MFLLIPADPGSASIVAVSMVRYVMPKLKAFNPHGALEVVVATVILIAVVLVLSALVLQIHFFG